MDEIVELPVVEREREEWAGRALPLQEARCGRGERVARKVRREIGNDPLEFARADDDLAERVLFQVRVGEDPVEGDDRQGVPGRMAS
jgi:hypothetical protein